MSLDVTHLKDLAIADTGFVFDPRSGYTFTVNPTGLAILRELKAGRSVAEAAAAVQDAFELEGGEDVARDVDDFILRLREQGLCK
jgi:PqqD family protein of HPr-rel-A system